MEIIKETKAIAELTGSETEKLFLLTKPYYLDPSNVFERELRHNTTIYLLKDHSGIILSFFMVAWEKHIIQCRQRDVVYLGLSCANQNNQEKRFASMVYYHFTRDAFAYEQENKERVILYGTTATPVVLSTLSKIWDDVRPDLEGAYSQNDREIIEDIKRSTGLDKFSSGHPFVLTGIASNTRYSAIEEARLKEFEIRNGIRIFEKLNINEAKGDRLLITCNVPGELKLDALRSKLFGE